MKDIYESFIMIRNPSSLNYWIIIVSIHKRTLHFYATEMFKFKRGLTSSLCKEMIPQNRQNRYELRNNADFTLL